MVLQRLARLGGGCAATAEGQFINCQTPGSMRELRFDGEIKRDGERGRMREGEWERAARLWSGRRLAGVQRETTRIIFYFSTFALLPRHPFMPIHPLTRAHLYKNTLRWLGRFRRGNNLWLPGPVRAVTMSWRRTRSVNT